MSDDPPQESLPSSSVAMDSTVENRPPKPQPFSRSFTIIFAIFAITLTIFRGMPFLKREPLSLLYYPDVTALWFVEQGMYLHEASAESSFRTLLPFTLFAVSRDELISDSENALRDSIEFLKKEQSDSTEKIEKLRAHLIVILCEARRFSEAKYETAHLGDGEDSRNFQQAVKAAYFEEPYFDEKNSVRYTKILESGWARSRLEARLDLLSKAKPTWTESWLRQQAKDWMAKLFVLSFVTLGLLIAGAYFFATILVPRWKAGFTEDTDPWPAGEGYGIFARSICYGTLLYFIIPRLPGNLRLLQFWNALILWGPTVWWFRHRISKPDNKKFADYFGLNLKQLQFGLLIGAGVALFAANYAGTITITKGLEAVGIKMHWAEGLNEYLMYETWLWRLAIFIEAVIWAPILEEILFRGLFFGALRKQMNWICAALISGLCFGAVHFYSYPGFLMVTFFGFVMALGYQKTGSLIPSIVAHALTNFILVWSSIWSTSSGS